MLIRLQRGQEDVIHPVDSRLCSPRELKAKAYIDWDADQRGMLEEAAPILCLAQFSDLLSRIAEYRIYLSMQPDEY